MHILVFCRYYLPGYRAGGPVRSISNLVSSLGSEACFWIVTSDRDLADVAPYSHIHTHQGLSPRNAHITYCQPGFHRVKRIVDIVGASPGDIIYLNSLFDPEFTLLPLLLRRLGIGRQKPVVLAPRGELSPGALRLKHNKKKIFLWLAKRSGLYRNLTWQASSAYEANDIRAVMGQAARIQVAPNIPSVLTDAHQQHVPSDEQGMPLRVIFLSRLAPKKNLDFALRSLQDLQVAVDFSIFGPAEDQAYVDRCRLLVSQLPRHIRVFWKGELRPEHVAETLAAHDLFFFPTRGENYGHVIAEALSAGTPVLISDTTPWRHLAAAGVGWDLPLDDISAFAACIHQFAALPAEEIVAWRQRARNYALERLNLTSILDANRRLFWNAACNYPQVTVRP